MKTKHRVSPYEILQVHPKASDEVITAAYRALLRKAEVGGSHPDKEFIDHLGQAYELVSDADRRTRYDEEHGPKAGKVIGEYRILENIATGGFGRTWKAQHILSGKLVCIKDCSEVDEKFWSVLVEEARTLWDLAHYALPAVRNIIQLPDNSYALVMSFIEGNNLEKEVEKHGRMDPEGVAWIGERCLNALAYLHDNAVLHGDIKPANIIVRENRHLIGLVDFGLAMISPDRRARSKGRTALFVAPEEEHGEITPQSDLFSLGMTMIYALNGGDTERMLRREVPVETPKAFAEFIRRLVTFDQAGRPDWKAENVWETIKQVRKAAFGRERSGMKPIHGKK